MTQPEAKSSVIPHKFTNERRTRGILTMSFEEFCENQRQWGSRYRGGSWYRKVFHRLKIYGYDFDRGKNGFRWPQLMGLAFDFGFRVPDYHGYYHWGAKGARWCFPSQWMRKYYEARFPQAAP